MPVDMDVGLCLPAISPSPLFYFFVIAVSRWPQTGSGAENSETVGFTSRRKRQASPRGHGGGACGPAEYVFQRTAWFFHPQGGTGFLGIEKAEGSNVKMEKGDDESFIRHVCI